MEVTKCSAPKVRWGGRATLKEVLHRDVRRPMSSKSARTVCVKKEQISFKTEKKKLRE